MNQKIYKFWSKNIFKDIKGKVKEVIGDAKESVDKCKDDALLRGRIFRLGIFSVVGEKSIQIRARGQRLRELYNNLEREIKELSEKPHPQDMIAVTDKTIAIKQMWDALERDHRSKLLQKDVKVHDSRQKAFDENDTARELWCSTHLKNVTRPWLERLLSQEKNHEEKK